MSKIYLTSDFHFFHENVMTYCDRYTPDRTCIEDWSNDLIYFLNGFIKEDDILLYLGDLALSRDKTLDGCKSWLDMIKCEKHFIRGNHDKWLSDTDILWLGFKTVRDYLRVDNTLFCHYSFDYPYGTFGQYKFHEYLWDLFYDNKNIHKFYHGHCHNTPLRNCEYKEGRVFVGDAELINCCIDKDPKNFNVVELDFNFDTFKEILNSGKNEVITESFIHTLKPSGNCESIWIER